MIKHKQHKEDKSGIIFLFILILAACIPSIVTEVDFSFLEKIALNLYSGFQSQEFTLANAHNDSSFPQDLIEKEKVICFSDVNEENLSKILNHIYSPTVFKITLEKCPFAGIYLRNSIQARAPPEKISIRTASIFI